MRASRPSVGTKAPFPGFIPPMLATTAIRPPAGSRWVHEVKFDGYRVQVHIASSDIKVFTRRGHDWTNRFRKVAEDAWHLNVKSAIIDGEVIAPSSDGVSDFSVLQKTLRSKKASQDLQMYAFDLPYLNGHDMRREPLLARKAELLRVIKGSGIFYSEHFEIAGATMLKRACAMGIEGIVSKMRDSRYQSDRTSNWLKVTCQQRETLRIVGYGLKNGRFDGAYLGREEKGALVYAGKVDHGFTPENAAELLKRMKPLVQTTQAYTTKIRKPQAVWVKPELLAEIEYRAQSEAGKVRHPVFKGLREDLA